MRGSKRTPSAVERSSPKTRRTWARGHERPIERYGERQRAPAERRTLGGDYLGHNKVDLYERARTLRIPGRSHMSKRELARAIARAQR